MKMLITKSNIIAGTSLALVSAFSIPTISVAQKNKSDNVIVKTITIINGDTTITEKTMSSDDSQKWENKTGAMAFTFSDYEKLKRINLDSLFKSKDMGSFNVFFDAEATDSSIKKMAGNIIINGTSGKTGTLAYNYTFNDSDDVIILNKDGNETKDEGVYNFVFADGETNKVMAINCNVIIKDMAPESKEKTSSTKNELKIDKLNFFPNPNSGNFMLEFESPNNDPIDIKITDIKGKQVYKETVRGEGHQSKQIDISNESKGAYFIQLQQGKKLSSKKIIIE